MAELSTDETSYIDYEAFLDPDFSPISFANSLILSTNDPSDTPLDLTTPLSRVLFDVQEVDTLIDSLTTKSALPLLEYTSTRANASNHILDTVESQVKVLSENYAVLQREVVDRYEEAELTRLAADRLCETVMLARELSRCLLAGRQLEIQMGEVSGTNSSVSSTGQTKSGDHRAMLRAANTLLSMKGMLSAEKKGEEGYMLSRVDAVKVLKSELLDPTERTLISRSQQIIREFSMAAPSSSGQGTSTNFAQIEETRARTTTAVMTLYLLSQALSTPSEQPREPTLLVDALTEYMQTALKSSIASLARSLATLPTLDKTLLEIAARCQNVLALESLLSSLKPPSHPLSTFRPFKSSEETKDDQSISLLSPLLDALDTSSLASYFWRTLANNMSPRVRDIVAKGGVSARTLKTNRDKVRDDIRACVDRGSRMPAGVLGGSTQQLNFDREAAVMVSSIVGVLGR